MRWIPSVGWLFATAIGVIGCSEFSGVDDRPSVVDVVGEPADDTPDLPVQTDILGSLASPDDGPLMTESADPDEDQQTTAVRRSEPLRDTIGSAKSSIRNVTIRKTSPPPGKRLKTAESSSSTVRQ